MNVDLRKGDCLEVMKDIPDNSVDMVLSDLPFGVTAASWDSIIPLDKLWEQYKRIVKDNGAIVLFGSQPFTTVLINSNFKGYKHHWIWKKNKGTGFQIVKYRPLMATEDIIAFTKNGERINYYPQMVKRDKPYKSSNAVSFSATNPLGTYNKGKKIVTERYPTNVIECGKVYKPIHPTQKPVELLEYLIKTYTNEGETVLDNCMGSGSCGVGAINTNRKFIGIELDKNYFEIAKNRIENLKNNQER